MKRSKRRKDRSRGSAWIVGNIVGAERPLTPQQVWAIRFYLNHEDRTRDRALFDIAISALRRRNCLF